MLGKTPLHIASQSGNKPAIRLLLQFSADITIRDIEGKKAIDIAKRPTTWEKLTFQQPTRRLLYNLGSVARYDVILLLEL